VHRLLVWCASPDTLNDPQEFVWQCDYTPTRATLMLLTRVLVKARGRTVTDAQSIAAAAIHNGRLKPIAKPVFDGVIEQCRNEIGVACFGATPDNPILWRRYGGDGAGVCIEFEVPAALFGSQLHRVECPKEKRLHVDQLLRAFVDHNEALVVYKAALLSKPSCWAEEEKIFNSSRNIAQFSLRLIERKCLAFSWATRSERMFAHESSGSRFKSGSRSEANSV
jgi:hypothetical protein